MTDRCWPAKKCEGDFKCRVHDGEHAVAVFTQPTSIAKGFAATVDQASDTAGSVPSIASDFETVKEALDAFIRYAIYHGSEVTITEAEVALHHIEAALVTLAADLEELQDCYDRSEARVRELEEHPITPQHEVEVDGLLARIAELEETLASYGPFGDGWHASEDVMRINELEAALREIADGAKPGGHLHYDVISRIARRALNEETT